MSTEKTVKNIPEEPKESERKPAGESNRILETIMKLPATKMLFDNVKSKKEQQEMIHFLVGLTKELNDEVEKYKKNIDKDSAIKIIEGLVGNGKRS
jgi:hypothetical protein